MAEKKNTKPAKTETKTKASSGKGKGSSGSQTALKGFSKREIILLSIAVILLIALVASLFFGGSISELLGFGKDDEGTPVVNYSFHSGNATVTIPSEFNLAEMVEVHFIDIEQGDAIYISFPGGENVIIDAGSGTGARTSATNGVKKEVRERYDAYLESLNITKVSHLISTHPDSDHINMLVYALDRFDVDNIYYNNVEGHSASYSYFLQQAAAETGVNLHPIGDKNSEYVWTAESAEYGYKLSIYAPGTDRFTDVNSMSVMCLLEYGGVKVLFTGDAHTDTEEWFVNLMKTKYPSGLDIDVLKVGHHGSQSSSSQAFLEYLKPEYGVISVGQTNTYDHPSPFAMNRLFEAGVATYRTNRHGNIVLYMDSDGDFGFISDIDVPLDNNKNYINERRLVPSPKAA